MLDLKKPDHSGKTRHTWKLGAGKRCIYVTDRLSTHNVVHKTPVPGKGVILNAMTLFWTLGPLSDVDNHIIAYGKAIYDHLPGSPGDYPDDFHHRAMIVHDLDMIDREFIGRAYLTGSLLKAYRRGEDDYGLDLPAGLVEMSRFERPIFTPTDKSETDDPLKASMVLVEHPEASLAAMATYETVRQYANNRGIEIVDFKQEWGWLGDRLMMADEWFTGDSARFVELDAIKEGTSPPWMDKEVFRREAETLWKDGPKVPISFANAPIRAGVECYNQLFERLADVPVSDFVRMHID